MTGLKRNVEFIMFKNGCQGTVLIFATERRFPSGGAFSQLRNEGGGCEMALMCQRVVTQLRNPLRNGFLAAKIGVLKLWGFRSPFRIIKGAKWHSCAKGWFRSYENFRRLHGAAKSFRSQGAFSQPRPDFAV